MTLLNRVLATSALSLSTVAAQANVQITEWMYSGAGGEYIEFTNLGSSAVNFAGWSYDDDSRLPGTFDLTGFGMVTAGESVLITEEDVAAYRTSWSLAASVKVLGPYTNNIGRADEINLYDAAGMRVDRLTYGDETVGGPRTRGASGTPVSLAALIPLDASVGWVLSATGDSCGSCASSAGDIGNPGLFTLAVPEPGTCALLLARGGGRRCGSPPGGLKGRYANPPTQTRTGRGRGRLVPRRRAGAEPTGPVEVPHLGHYTLDTLGELGLEASAVTYARDRGTLSYVGDEGPGVVEISLTGQTIGSMRFSNWPAASTNNDAEGLTYLGNGVPGAATSGLRWRRLRSSLAAMDVVICGGGSPLPRLAIADGASCAPACRFPLARSCVSSVRYHGVGANFGLGAGHRSDRMKRRQLTTAALGACIQALPWLSQAQARRVRIGWLGNTRPESGPAAQAIFDAFIVELARLGWKEGQDVEIERRFAEGAVDRFPALAAELARSNVDLIVAVSTDAARAAFAAAPATPIVFVSVTQPVEQGLVASLSHPGGRMTGVASLNSELIGKRMEILHQAFPQRRSLALLTERPGQSPFDAGALRVAASLCLRLAVATVDGPAGFEAAVASQPAAEAWFVQNASRFFNERSRLVEAVNRSARPAIYPLRIYVEAGGLMSYAPDQRADFRRLADIVARVLRGARPADIPVEQATRLELVLNLKTARASGITIPQSLRLRADEVIE
jgi:hypothetical protein